MIKVLLERKKCGIHATGLFDEETRALIVLAGSTVSQDIKHTEKFRGAKSIEASRKDTVIDGKVITDVKFKSASTAANYVTGGSTNGLVAWKTEEGNTIKDYLANK